MKIAAIALGLFIGANSVHVKYESHQLDYSGLPNWQNLCNGVGGRVCGLIDKDCCLGGCTRDNPFKVDCLDRGGRVGEGELRQRAQNLNLLER